MNLHPSIPQPFAFNIMAKPSGAICNLDCQYCYFLKKEKLYANSIFRMTDETLENYIRQYIKAHRTPEVTFSWQGGEPMLMGLDFFKKAVAYQQKYKRPPMRIQNAFQTNGTLLDDATCAFFKENKFLVGLSLDGPREIHDTYRVDKGGKSSFDRVIAGLNLLKKHKVDFNILTTVHAANASKPLEIYRFLRDEIDAEFIQFIPIVERKNNTGNQEGYQVTKRSVTGRQYGDFLISIFDEWIKRDVGQVFVQIFDVSLAAWYGTRPGLCIFEPTCGQALALEHNGDLYACDHYVEPDFLLGNIHKTSLTELVTLPQQYQFGQDKKDTLPRYCQECEVRFICNGGCPKNRIRKTPDGEEGLNYLCPAYKTFFNHIDRPMRVMANLLRSGKPPAEVMGKFAK